MAVTGAWGLLGQARFGATGTLDWAHRETNRVLEDAVLGIWGCGDVARWLTERMGHRKVTETTQEVLS